MNAVDERKINMGIGMKTFGAGAIAVAATLCAVHGSTALVADMPSNIAYAADGNNTTSASVSAEALSAYKQTLKKLTKMHPREGASGVFADLDGDGQKEMVCTYKTVLGWSGVNLEIYTFKDGEAKLLLQDGGYGLDYIKYSSKGKTFALYRCGHGGEGFRYFQLKGDEYKQIALKGRSNADGRSHSWGYSFVNGDRATSVSKAKFEKKIKPLMTGKLRLIRLP